MNDLGNEENCILCDQGVKKGDQLNDIGSHNIFCSGQCFSKTCNLISFSTIRHGRVITILIYFINPFYAR